MTAKRQLSFLTDIRYRLEYGLLRIIIGMIRLMPLDTAVRFSAYWWQKLGARGRRHQRALENIARAFPEKTETEREEIIHEMWGNLGRVMAETMQMDRVLKRADRIKIINPHILKRYKHRMGPAVFVSMHMGNWEVASWPLAKAGINLAGVYRLVKNPYVDGYLRAQRKALYPGGLFAKGKMGGHMAGHMAARSIAAQIRKGGRIGFLADLHEATGITVPFFNIPAHSNPFPAVLARRTGARVWAGFCRRIGTQSNFEVELKEIRVPFSEDKDQDVAELTAAIQKQFEDWIKKAPEQFMWSNRRWCDKCGG